MALLKNIKYPNGTESNYHKISRLTLAKFREKSLHYPEPNFNEEEPVPVEPVEEFVEKYEIEVYVYSYTSKEVRDNSLGNYLKEYHFYLTTSAELAETNPIFPLVYELLKNTPEFQDAEDA